MLALHHVRDVRVRAVGNAPGSTSLVQTWYELDFDAEDTVGICFYPAVGSGAERKLQAICKLLNNWDSTPLAENPDGDHSAAPHPE